MANRFSQDFFLQPTLDVAKGLLGSYLETKVEGKVTSGIIVEVEAYGGNHHDPACHAHRGKTKRTEVMFKKGGLSYVYFIYGMYYCVNVVTEDEEVGAAVLIRAVEPVKGTSHMRRRRVLNETSKTNEPPLSLTNGPGKLCEALGITKALNGEDLIKSPRIHLEKGNKIAPKDIVCSHRIGISKARELPWRFYIANNKWVSMK